MTEDELKAFIEARVRKALLAILDEAFPPYPETQVIAPPHAQELPAWARHEEGTGH